MKRKGAKGYRKDRKGLKSKHLFFASFAYSLRSLR
jgi:hypothetical protein